MVYDSFYLNCGLYSYPVRICTVPVDTQNLKNCMSLVTTYYSRRWRQLCCFWVHVQTYWLKSLIPLISLSLMPSTYSFLHIHESTTYPIYADDHHISPLPTVLQNKKRNIRAAIWTINRHSSTHVLFIDLTLTIFWKLTICSLILCVKKVQSIL